MSHDRRQLDHAGFRWWVTGDEGEALVAAARPDLAHLFEATAERIKHSPVRTVWRVGRYFVKEYRSRGLVERLRTLLFGSKAQAEWRAALRLADLGIPAIEGVALAAGRGRGAAGRSLLVTRAIEGGVSPAVLLGPGGLIGANRRRLVEAMAALVGKLHDAGVEHRDLHAENFLVVMAPGPPTVRLLDLHRVRFHRRMGPAARLRNLGHLLAAFQTLASRADQLRFLKVYGAALGPPVDRRAVARTILRHAARQSRRLWRRRDRRAVRSGKYFRVRRDWHRTAVMVAQWDNSLHRNWLQNPDALAQGPGAEVVKEGRSVLVVRTSVLAAGGPQRVFVKRFNMWKLRQRFQRSRAMRAWRIGQAMLTRGLATPRPLAAVNRRWLGPLTRRAWLITEEVPGTVLLYHYLRDPAVGPEQRRRAVEALGRLLARMHRAGFSHADLKLTNILAAAAAGPSGERADLYVLDLDSARQYRWRVPRRRRVRDLARVVRALEELQAARPDAGAEAWTEALLPAYLGPWANGDVTTDWRRAVRRRTDRLIAKRDRPRGKAAIWPARRKADWS